MLSFTHQAIQPAPANSPSNTRTAAPIPIRHQSLDVLLISHRRITQPRSQEQSHGGFKIEGHALKEVDSQQPPPEARRVERFAGDERHVDLLIAEHDVQLA